MTVEELIEILKEFDPERDAKAWAICGSGREYLEKYSGPYEEKGILIIR